MGVQVTTTEEGEVVGVGIPVGTDAFMRAHAEKVMKDNGVERFARHLAGTPEKQEAMLIATKSMSEKTCFLERGLDRPSTAEDAEARPRTPGSGGRRNASSLTNARVTTSTSSHTDGCK